MALHQDLNTTPLPSLILVGKNNLRMNTTTVQLIHPENWSSY
jgi:hypothetical protein